MPHDLVFAVGVGGAVSWVSLCQSKFDRLVRGSRSGIGAEMVPQGQVVPPLRVVGTDYVKVGNAVVRVGRSG